MIRLKDILTEAQHPEYVKVVKDYIRLTNPENEYYDMSDNDSKLLAKIENDAADGGYLDDLQNASYKSHYPRTKIQKDDPYKFRDWWIKHTDNRITKSGKLNKNSAKWLKNVIKRDRDNR